jgi:hypothetical protein
MTRNQELALIEEQVAEQAGEWEVLRARLEPLRANPIPVTAELLERAATNHASSEPVPPHAIRG